MIIYSGVPAMIRGRSMRLQRCLARVSRLQSRSGRQKGFPFHHSVLHAFAVKSCGPEILRFEAFPGRVRSSGGAAARCRGHLGGRLQ